MQLPSSIVASSFPFGHDGQFHASKSVQPKHEEPSPLHTPHWSVLLVVQSGSKSEQSSIQPISTSTEQNDVCVSISPKPS